MLRRPRWSGSSSIVRSGRHPVGLVRTPGRDLDARHGSMPGAESMMAKLSTSELKGRKLGRALTKMGKVTREQVHEALANDGNPV